MPSPEMNVAIDFLRKRKNARAGDRQPPLEEVRKSFAPVGHLRPIPEDVAVSAADANGVPSFWLAAPGTAESSKVIFYLHGGGYSRGGLSSHGPLAATLGRALSRRVFLVEYRLAPEFPFPCAYDDTVTAWRWLVSAGGVDAGSVIVAGDSAGGGLGLALMHTLRDAGEALPAAALLMSPYVDLTSSGASMVERAEQDPGLTPEYMRDTAAMYLHGADARDPRASPLFASQAGLPSMLIQVGSAEILFSDSERLARAAAEAGVEVTLDVAEDLPHVYHGALDAPETMRAIAQMAEFAKRVG